MNSVSLQTKLSHNTKLRLKACLDYSNFLDERTCYELMEFYVDAQTKIFHWCNKHKKSYLAKPNNIKSGKQLKCCGNEAKSDYKIKMALARHKEKIRTRGYLLTGDYQGMNVEVEYFCIRHQETDKRKPVIMNRGSAVLECCKQERDKKIAQAKKKRSLEKLLNYLNGKDHIYYVGEFDGMLKKAKFGCRIHGHEDYALPANISKGKGLKCCGRSNHFLDEIQNLVFTDNLRRHGKHYLYVFKLVGLEDYVKIGITYDYKNRSKPYYPKIPQLLSELSDRREARFIEESLKHQFRSYQSVPDELKSIS